MDTVNNIPEISGALWYILKAKAIASTEGIIIIISEGFRMYYVLGKSLYGMNRGFFDFTGPISLVGKNHVLCGM